MGKLIRAVLRGRDGGNIILLPDTLVTATVLDLEGNRLAPPLFLDSGGFDGRQAHTRRHIDRLKKKVAKLEAQRDRFPVGDQRREPAKSKLSVLNREMARCWRKYEARNNDLAHLAANILILLATVWDAELISGESLKSLKSEGRGRGAKGRWVHWRNNSQIRGALWRVLRYKCHMAGLRLEWQYASGTTHTCPHCVTPVKGHHLSGEQSPTSSGNGSMPNVSLTTEREVKDQSMTPKEGERWFQQTGVSLRAISTW